MKGLDKRVQLELVRIYDRINEINYRLIESDSFEFSDLRSELNSLEGTLYSYGVDLEEIENWKENNDY